MSKIIESSVDAIQKKDLHNITLAFQSCGAKPIRTAGEEQISTQTVKNSILYKTLVERNCINDLPAPPHNAPRKYYGYFSDGTNWELTAALDNLHDSQCIQKNGFCVYRIRNGKLNN